MSTDTGEQVATEQDVDKLRKWVDDLRVAHPPEAPKAPTEIDPKPQGNVLKAPHEPSKGAALLADLVQRIDVRAAVRVEQLSDLRRAEVSTEKADREEKKILDDKLGEVHRTYIQLTSELGARYEADVAARKESLAARRQLIASLDKSLDQMRKQVVVEVAKLAPERKEE